MVEILIGAWVISLVLSVPLTMWNINSVLKISRSTELKTLNANLVKVGLFWSLSNETFWPLEELTPEEDFKKSVRGYLLLGALGLFSVLGLLILFVVSVSIHKLIRNRTAESVFKSELSRRPDLEVKSIEALVNSFGGFIKPRMADGKT